jgi:phage terminase large subunit-like protein
MPDDGVGLWPSEGPTAVRWIEDNLIFPEGDTFGEPFRLRRDQKLFLYRWYEYCGGCNRWRYNEGVRGAATGDGKTTFIAAIALLEFAGPNTIAPKSPIICVAAAAWDQADELFRKAGQMVGGKGDEITKAPLCGFFNVTDTKITFKNGVPGMLERVAAVAGTNEGGLPSLFICDEVHEWGDVGSNKARVHTVIGKSTKKRRSARGSGRILNLSTAGFDVEHSLLGAMYLHGKAVLQDPALDPKLLFDWQEADETLDLEDPDQRRLAVRQASKAADVIWDVEDRVREWGKPSMPAHEWIRYYANRWVDLVEESWLADYPAAWGKCRGTWDTDPAHPFTVAVDMALKHDSVAVVRCEDLPDGRLAVTTKIWKANNAGQVDHLAVWNHVNDLAVGRGFRGVVYDPRFFELPARMLEQRGVLAVQFDQSPQRMAPAVGLTRRLIIDGELVHDGGQELGSAVKSAVSVPQERGGITLRKSKSKRHIDACVAMCMGAYALREIVPAPPPATIDVTKDYGAGDLWRPTSRLAI